MSKFEPLSTARIAAAKAAGKDTWLADSDGRRGFGRLMLRVSPNGAKHFYFRICSGGQRRSVPLGPYSKDSKPNHLTLKQAREAAQDLLPQLRKNPMPVQTAPTPAESSLSRLGSHPKKSAAAPVPKQGDVPQVEPSLGGGTLEELCAAYVDHLRREGKASATEVEYRFRRYLNGTALGRTPAAQVTGKAIASHLRAMIDKGIGTTTRQLRSIIGTAYSLAQKCDTDASVSGDFSKFQISTNPVNQTASLAKLTKPRQRTLNSVELAYLWQTLDTEVNDSVAQRVSDRFIRMTLFLGGQRCEQLARVTTANVDTEAWTITLLDGKGRRPEPRVHRIPISNYARDDVKWLLQYATDLGSSFLFPGPIRPKERLTNDAVAARVSVISKNLLKLHKVPRFSYSDLRRTTQTLMTSLQIPEEVSNQILSHGLGGIVKRHYNSYPYEKEMRQALEQWGAYLTSLKPPAR
ncbi:MULTISPECIES: tyrosine-type recombinase/integrase [Roseateles]|nr:integrase family protein [Roseateles puraquae]MDG0853862.1 DUF4102 domain-containing protein [Roseateles puraquae]RTL22484.1 MAG: DUF4102 domain-containing protein [Burkholderiales bacterium]